MTDAVRRGLSMAMTLADNWREADSDDTLTPVEVADLDAAEAWIGAGGLRCDGPDPEDDGRTNSDLAREAAEDA